MGTKLRELREKQGITIRECSNKTGISTRTIMRYEKGEYNQIEYLEILASFYGVSLDELVEYSPKTRRNPVDGVSNKA